jgi:hypothetical protein
MAHVFLKRLNSLVTNLRKFSPAQIKSWASFVIALALLVVVVVHSIVALEQIGYGPWFFNLLMQSLGRSR